MGAGRSTHVRIVEMCQAGWSRVDYHQGWQAHHGHLSQFGKAYSMVIVGAQLCQSVPPAHQTQHVQLFSTSLTCSTRQYVQFISWSVNQLSLFLLIVHFIINYLVTGPDSISNSYERTYSGTNLISTRQILSIRFDSKYLTNQNFWYAESNHHYHMHLELLKANSFGGVNT